MCVVYMQADYVNEIAMTDMSMTNPPGLVAPPLPPPAPPPPPPRHPPTFTHARNIRYVRLSCCQVKWCTVCGL
jgi:hypothetical protein